MKCSASQTTCIADNAAAMRQGVTQFEGLLFAQMLKPFEKAFGPMGDIACAQFGAAIARSQSTGLADALAASLQRAEGGA